MSQFCHGPSHPGEPEGIVLVTTDYEQKEGGRTMTVFVVRSFIPSSFEVATRLA
jgi:hypothetical protein